jgi:hypothetical protein
MVGVLESRGRLASHRLARVAHAGGAALMAVNWLEVVAILALLVALGALLLSERH